MLLGLALRARSDPSTQGQTAATGPHQHHSSGAAPSHPQPTAMEVEPSYTHHSHYHRRGQGRSRGSFPAHGFAPSSLPLSLGFLPPGHTLDCTQSGSLEMPLGFSMGHPLPSAGYYPSSVPPSQPPLAPPPRQSDSEDSPMVGVCVQQSPVASH